MVKTPTIRPNDLSSVPGIHTVEGENCPLDIKSIKSKKKVKGCRYTPVWASGPGLTSLLLHRV